MEVYRCSLDFNQSWTTWDTDFELHVLSTNITPLFYVLYVILSCGRKTLSSTNVREIRTVMNKDLSLLQKSIFHYSVLYSWNITPKIACASFIFNKTEQISHPNWILQILFWFNNTESTWTCCTFLFNSAPFLCHYRNCVTIRSRCCFSAWLFARFDGLIDYHHVIPQL